MAPLAARKIFFYFYILLFFITAPMVVLYTAGYRFNFEAGRFVQTGTVSVNSTPKNAVIRFNSVFLKKTPGIIRQVLPGTYTITLEKDGFHSWSREIDVRSRETTYIEDVVLFLESDLEIVQQEDYDAFSISPSGILAYATTTDSWTEIWRLDVSSGEQFLLDRIANLDPSAIRFEWSNSGDYLMVTNENGTQFFRNTLIDLKSEAESIITIATNIHFDRAADPIVFVETPFRSHLLNLQNGEVENLDNDIIDTAANNAFSLVQSNDFVLLNDNANDRAIAALPQSDYQILDVNDTFVLVEKLTTRQHILIDTQTQREPIALQEYMTEFEWKDGYLYFSDGFELSRYNTQTGETTLLTRTSEVMNTIDIYPEGNVLIIGYSNRIEALDVSDISRTVTTNLAFMDQIDTFWLSRRGEMLYLTGTEEIDSGAFVISLNE